MNFLIISIAASLNLWAAEATMDWVLTDQRVRCGEVELHFGAKGLLKYSRVGTVENAFGIKWSAQSAVLTPKDAAVAQKKLSLHWSSTGNGLLYVNRDVCEYF